MFFLYDLERTITLHPFYFGPHMRDYLIHKLLTDVEGTCTGRYYIICVLDAYNISMGKILPGSGLAEFTISYRAVVWRPFKGETVCIGAPHECISEGIVMARTIADLMAVLGVSVYRLTASLLRLASSVSSPMSAHCLSLCPPT
ncbi:hypothetical protein ABW21_db0206418 [Orbilia brochopaga]|nr:hypothetical protein ABW21_db0206418 [Drechslerella brochopaga]